MGKGDTWLKRGKYSDTNVLAKLWSLLKVWAGKKIKNYPNKNGVALSPMDFLMMLLNLSVGKDTQLLIWMIKSKGKLCTTQI